MLRGIKIAVIFMYKEGNSMISNMLCHMVRDLSALLCTRSDVGRDLCREMKK